MHFAGIKIYCHVKNGLRITTISNVGRTFFFFVHGDNKSIRYSMSEIHTTIEILHFLKFN